MPTTASDKVDKPGIAYKEMEVKWLKLHALLGGTQAMRDAGTTWLPKEPGEKTEKYKVRRERSFLFNAYADTIVRLTNKPFAKPVTFSGGLPEALEPMKDNIDGTGRNITQFGREVFRTAVIYGLTHILVDFPKMVDETGEPTLQRASDDMDTNATPVFKHIPPPNLIGWKWKDDRLIQIRVKETRLEEDGRWGDKKVEYIRVYGEKEWELFRKDKNEFVPFKKGTHSFGKVPLLTFYTNEKTGPLTANPPLEDLAWINIAHWQTYSDVRNILRFASVGILFGAGFSEEEIAQNMTIGPHTVARSENPEAKLNYVEYKGQAIQAGQTHLDKLEERMEVLGMQPLVRRKSGSTTATGKAIDESRSNADAEAWARGEEDILKSAFEFAAQWRKVKLKEDFGVNIFNEFGIALNKDGDVKALIDLWKAKGLDLETMLQEMARRGLLSEDTDIEVIIARIEAENLPPEPPDGDDEEDEDAEVEEEEEVTV